MTGRLVFIHGAGRSGVDAWPAQRDVDFGWEKVFLDRVGFGPAEVPTRTDFAGDARRVLDACPPEGAVLVASSYGGIAALQAAAREPQLVLGMVLCEPAAYSIARGCPHVEDHIRRVEPVFARASKLDGVQFFLELMSAFGQPDPLPPTTDDGRLRAERLRLQEPPWSAAIDPRVADRIPTVVVTGGWNLEYEEIAAVLKSHGARHDVIEGNGHNPERSQVFVDLLQEFVSEIGG